MNKIQNTNFDSGLLKLLIKKYNGNENNLQNAEFKKIKLINTIRSNTDMSLLASSTLPSENIDTKKIQYSDAPLTHNNMVPFFGGNSKQNMDYDNRQYSEKLDIFTGQFKLKPQHKTETETLFSPVPQNLNSAEPLRDNNRYATSCTIKRGEKPMEQIRVARGLNNGYTDLGNGGFHNTLRILPLTTEQRNVNPKVQFAQPIITGKSNIINRPSAPNLYHNRQKILIDNENGQRNFVTTGEVIAPRIYSDVILQDTNRKNVKYVIGNSGNTKNDPLPCDRRAKVKQSTKVTFKNDPVRNLHKSDLTKYNNNKESIHLSSNMRNEAQKRYSDPNATYNMSNIGSDVPHNSNYNLNPPAETKKQLTIDNSFGGMLKSFIKNIVYDPNDKPDITARETYENNTQSGAIKSAKNGQITYDPNDRPDVTTRETYENNTHSGTIKSAKNGQITYDPNDRPDVTTRETYENNTHSGTIKSSKTGQITYDPNDRPDITTRETYENNTQSGAIKSAKNGQITYDPNDRPDITARETYENNTQSGTIKSTKNGQITYDPNDRPDITTRETYENNKHNGTIKSAKTGQITYDPNDRPDITARETYENNKHNGAIKSSKNGQITYDPNDRPDITTRETYENNTKSGAIKSAKSGQIAYDPNDRPDVTARETYENNTQSGTIKSSKNGQIAYDPNDRPDITARETYENNKHSGTIKSSKTGQITYDPNDRPDITTRETYENNKHSGTIKSSKTGQITYDPNDRPDYTSRETYENNKHSGTMKPLNTGHIAHDPFDKPMITIKDTLIDMKYQYGVNSQTLQNTDGYKVAPTDINNTQRQTYSDYYHVNSGTDKSGQRIYDDAYSMRQNEMSEIVSSNRAPNSCNVSLYNSSLNIDIKKLDSDRVNNVQHMPTLIPAGERKPMNTCEVTRMKNSLPSRNQSFDPQLLDAFKRNPLTQSLHSWA
jgi:hypothetical protein